MAKRVTKIQDPEIEKPIEKVPDIEVSTPETIDVSSFEIPEVKEPVVEKAPKALVCTATLLPGGKYQVMYGNKLVGRFGKEKAELICKNLNK